ncbi:MAG: hypothetical protein ABEI06_09290, partial [Halobacteriaceae archaeon]
MPTSSGSDASSTRGQSEVIGIVLILSITIIGTIAILTIGSAVLQDARQNAEISRAEQAMTK